MKPIPAIPSIADDGGSPDSFRRAMAALIIPNAPPVKPVASAPAFVAEIMRDRPARYPMQPCNCPIGKHLADCPDGYEEGTYDDPALLGEEE